MSPMLTPVITPSSHVHNVAELCGLLLIDRPAQVPVAAFRVISDGQKHEFLVESTSQSWRHAPLALILFYFMDRVGHPQYDLTSEMRNELCNYVGAEAVFQATQFDTEDQALRALLGDDVHVELVLTPGYGEHLAPSRHATEIIERAWARRESLTTRSPEPFLRRALAVLLEMLDDDGQVMAQNDSASFVKWADTWGKRTLELHRHLQGELIPA